MAIIEMKELLECGVHFGHQTRAWNPKMKPYIYQERNGIHIIDLKQSLTLVEKAYEFLKKEVEEGKTVLFVGTKKQAQEIIKKEAERAGVYYVNSRWLGGMLTNFKTIRNSVERLKKLEKMEEEGVYDLLTKKEVLELKKEYEKLNTNLGGIKEMEKLPDIIFVVDSEMEKIAISEAKKLNIPIIAMLDTNSNPEGIDYVIPANDDAIRSIALITEKMANAIVAGKTGEEITLEEKEIVQEENKEENKEEKKEEEVEEAKEETEE